MSGSKRAVAEIRFGEDRAGVAKVGGRSIHQYWSMLSPHFRDVFLSPQRRSDDGGVSWTWREPSEQQPLTASELASLRGRLERAKESFEENPVSPLMSEARGGGASSQEIIDQLMVRVKALAEGLAGKTDVALAEYVCRTETGVMVHSWGLNAAAKISYPDSQESAVSGRVVFGGKGSASNEVVIENARGLRVARTTTDEKGEFGFPKLAPGRYRVRVISGPGEFSNKGVSVAVERGETSRIELRSTSDPEAPDEEADGSAGQSATDTSAPIVARRRRTWRWIAMVAALLLLGGGGWIWRTHYSSDKSDQQTTQRVSTLTPEKFSSEKPAAHSEGPARTGSGVEPGLGAVANGPDETQSPTTRRETPSIGVPSLSTDAAVGGGPVSKIGTRVELSGVNAVGTNAKPSSAAPNASREATKQPSANHASMETRSGLVEQTSSGAEADSSDENRTAASATTSKTETETETRSSAGGAPKESLSGNMPAGVAGVIPESPAGREEEKMRGMAVDAGLASDKKKSGSGKPAGFPVTDRAKKGVSSGDAIAVSSDGEAASGGPAAKQIAGQGPEVVVTVLEKPTNKSQTPVATGDGKPENSSDTISSSPSSPDDSGAIAGKPNDRKDPKAEARKAAAQASSSGSGNSTISPATSSASATSMPGTSESAENEKGETPKNANESSAASSSVDVAADGGGDKTPASASAEGGTENIARPSRGSGMIQGKPLPAGMQIIGSVKLGEWNLRIGRDAIVPTLPLRDGEADQTETLRRKMIEEQKARLPATLKRPKLVSGFAFKFAASAKPQSLRWSTEGRPDLTLVAQDYRAEIDWALESVPREGVFTLAYADGTEVARVEFDRSGRATVAVRPEMRAVFLLGALYAEADRATPGNKSRIAWQVVRGPLASTAWTYDSRWLEGTGCRLEVVLNGANPARTRIALIDQASDWQLVTELE